MANDRDDLSYMARKLQRKYREWGLELNADKTKYLPIEVKSMDIILEDNSIIKTCIDYKYLGVIFDLTGLDNKEIRAKVSQARKIIGCLNSVFWSTELGKKRK